MKIVDIRSAVVVVPLTRPVSWATAAVTEREYVLVWAIGEDGTFGIGYGLGSRYPGGAKAIHDIVCEQLAGEAIGTDFLDDGSAVGRTLPAHASPRPPGSGAAGDQRSRHCAVGPQRQGRRAAALSLARRVSRRSPGLRFRRLLHRATTI